MCTYDLLMLLLWLDYVVSLHQEIPSLPEQCLLIITENKLLIIICRTAFTKQLQSSVFCKCTGGAPCWEGLWTRRQVPFI